MGIFCCKKDKKNSSVPVNGCKEVEIVPSVLVKEEIPIKTNAPEKNVPATPAPSVPTTAKKQPLIDAEEEQERCSSNEQLPGSTKKEKNVKQPSNTLHIECAETPKAAATPNVLSPGTGKGAFTSPNTPFFCSQTCPNASEVKEFSKNIDKMIASPTAGSSLSMKIGNSSQTKSNNNQHAPVAKLMVNVEAPAAGLGSVSTILSPPPPTPNTYSRFEEEVKRKEEQAKIEKKTYKLQQLSQKNRYATEFKPMDENSTSISITLDHNADDSELLEELREPLKACNKDDDSFSGSVHCGTEPVEKGTVFTVSVTASPNTMSELDPLSFEKTDNDIEFSNLRKPGESDDFELEEGKQEIKTTSGSLPVSLEAINEQSSSENEKFEGYYYVHSTSNKVPDVEERVVQAPYDSYEELKIQLDEKEENGQEIDEYNEESDDMYNPALYNGILPIPARMDRGKKLLVLDLDETLVHSSFSYEQDAEMVVNVTITNDATNTVDRHVIYVHKRPFVDEFLEFCTKNFECCIFTASMSVYASAVMEQLDPNHTIKNILCREHCTYINQVMVKDLSKLGRDLKKIIIIDNAPTSFAFQKLNGITAVEFRDDKNDTYLYDLMETLKEMKSIDDVTEYIRENGLNEYCRGL